MKSSETLRRFRHAGMQPLTQENMKSNIIKCNITQWRLNVTFRFKKLLTHCLKNLSPCPLRSCATRSHEAAMSAVSGFVITVILARGTIGWLALPPTRRLISLSVPPSLQLFARRTRHADSDARARPGRMIESLICGCRAIGHRFVPSTSRTFEYGEY